MADTARKHFAKYYTPFIGHMKSIIAVRSLGARVSPSLHLPGLVVLALLV